MDVLKNIKLQGLRSPDSRISFRRAPSNECADYEVEPLKRDPRDAKGGIAEEFPLLCARAGASVIPQVMMLHPTTGQPVPLNQSPPESPTKQGRDSPGKPSSPAKERRTSTPVLDGPFNKEKCGPPLPIVLVYFEDNENQINLQKLVIKGFPVDDGIITAVGTLLYYHNTLKELRIVDASLTAPVLRKLVKYLSATKSIRELVLDGNPIKEQNYSLLLREDTGLQNLCLRKCEIDDEAVRAIARELKFKDPPLIQTLVKLNLSENLIGDKGLEYLAYGLRTNRTLLQLVLAKNLVGDPGALALASVGMKFPLDSEELKYRRNRALQRNKVRCAMVQQKLLELGLTSKAEPPVHSRKDIRRSTDTFSMILVELYVCDLRNDEVTRKCYPKWGLESSSHDLAPLVLYDRALTHVVSDIVLQEIESEVDQTLNWDDHPYSWETRPENMDMWCIGNFNLKEINLNQNKIGLLGVQKFLDALEYQTSLKEKEGRKPDSGFSSIMLDDNKVSWACSQLQQIQERLTVNLRAIIPPKDRKPVSPSKRAGTSKDVSVEDQANKDDLRRSVAKAQGVGTGASLLQHRSDSVSRKTDKRRSSAHKKSMTHEVGRKFGEFSPPD